MAKIPKEVCVVCGFSIPSALETHHVKPKSNGGGTTSTNCVVLCRNSHGVIGATVGRFNGRVPDLKHLTRTANIIKRFVHELKARGYK